VKISRLNLAFQNLEEQEDHIAPIVEAAKKHSTVSI